MSVFEVQLFPHVSARNVSHLSCFWYSFLFIYCGPPPAFKKTTWHSGFHSQKCLVLRVIIIRHAPERQLPGHNQILWVQSSLRNMLGTKKTVSMEMHPKTCQRVIAMEEAVLNTTLLKKSNLTMDCFPVSLLIQWGVNTPQHKTSLISMLRGRYMRRYIKSQLINPPVGSGSLNILWLYN